VDVLGCALKFGKNREIVAGVGRLRVVHFKQSGFIALNN
jgi:hypothetical protein